MFPPAVPPPAWDVNKTYTVDSIEIYFLLNATRDISESIREAAEIAENEVKKLEFNSAREVTGKKRQLFLVLIISFSLHT
jgi:hypothetical protein